MKVAYNFDESDNGGVVAGISENQETIKEPSTNDVDSSGTTPEVKRTDSELSDNSDATRRTDTSENGTPTERTRIETSENGTLEEPQEQSEELSEKAFLSYVNKRNGTKFKSVDEYQNSYTKEVTKEVIKLPEYDEETSAFFRFKKDTGGSFKEWVALNDNHDEKSDVEIAIDKIKKDNDGLTLSDSQATLLLAEELGIDVDEFEDLSDKEKLKLSILANKHKKVLKKEQEKYRQSAEVTSKTDATQPSDEQVMVAGKSMDKAVYERQRKEYLTAREEAVKSIEKYDFSLEIDGKDGTTSQLDFTYVPTPEDKQNMLSVTESIDNILPKFLNDEGQLDHRAFNESIGFWADQQLREKAIKSISQQAYAAGVDAVLKQERNIDFDNKMKPSQEKKIPEGYGVIGAKQPNGVSVKYKFNG